MRWLGSSVRLGGRRVFAAFGGLALFQLGCGVEPGQQGTGGLLQIAGDVSSGPLSATPTTLMFETHLTVREFELRNNSDRVASYTASVDTEWLATDIRAGEIGRDVQRVRVSVDRTSLAAGIHQGTVTVDVAGAADLRVNVVVDTLAGNTTPGPAAAPSNNPWLPPTPLNGPGGPDGGKGPRLYVAPDTLDFGPRVAGGVAYVRNVGDGELAYEASVDAPWARLENAQGVSTGEYKPIYIYVERGGLSPGQYSGRLSVIAGEQRAAVTLRMSVPDPGQQTKDPELYVSTSALEFGTDRVRLSFIIRNVGGGTLNYYVASDVIWGSPTPKSGALTNEDAEVQVDVVRNGLEAGEYTGLIGVSADTGQWHGLVVRMIVPQQLPLLWVSTDHLDFGVDALQLSFGLRRSDAGTLPFSITPSEAWIEAEPAQGVATPDEQTIWVTATRCCFPCAPGAHVAELRIDTEGGGHRIIQVRMELEAGPSEGEIISRLRPLPPLPKVHYSWPTPPHLLDDPNDPLLYEWVRLTHSVGLSAFYYVPGWIDAAVAVCQQVNATNPSLAATIALNYSPYHLGGWPPAAPPTYNGPEYQMELNICRQNFSQVKALLEAANRARGANVKVSAIFLDTELWLVKEAWEPGYQEWNRALTEKYDAVYTICKSIFPDVPVHWYYRGLPCCWRLFTLEEQGDSCSSAAYNTPNLDFLRLVFRNIHAEAKAHNIDLVIPWIALGEAYYTLPDGKQRYICALDYDLQLSWQLGAEINDPWYAQFPERYAPWDAAKAVMFYPGPFQQHAPYFAKHLVAYVKGAHGIPLGSP